MNYDIISMNKHDNCIINKKDDENAIKSVGKRRREKRQETLIEEK